MTLDTSSMYLNLIQAWWSPLLELSSQRNKQYVTLKGTKWREICCLSCWWFISETPTTSLQIQYVQNIAGISISKKLIKTKFLEKYYGLDFIKIWLAWYACFSMLWNSLPENIRCIYQADVQIWGGKILRI